MKRCRKLFYLIPAFAVMIFVGCSNKGRSSENVDYEYSDYVFDNDAPQYYMSNSSAAAPSGYYFIGDAAISTGSERFLYYFDMVNKSVMPLCTKLNCEHNSQDCDAYVSDKSRVTGGLWYYNNRLYMIERTDEKDLLVSYDKTGRDKKTEAVLSVNGMSVVSSRQRACFSHGKLYYILTSEKTQYLYYVQVGTNTQPQFIKEYSTVYGIRETITLYPVGEKVYVKLVSGITDVTNDYILESIDINDNNVSKVYDYMSDGSIFRGEADDWNNGAYIDESGNMYFISLTEDSYILNKMNTVSKDNEEIFVIDLSQDTGKKEAYTDFLGIDDKYIYILERVDFSIAENRKNKELKNKLDILDTKGNIVDVIEFTTNDEYAKENQVGTEGNGLQFDFFNGDSRYMLFAVEGYSKTGIEFSEQNIKKYKECVEKLRGQQKTVTTYSYAVIDKKDIGTGNCKIINVTP